MRNPWILLLAPLALAIPDPASAQTPEERGLAIAEEVHRRDAGWQDQTAAMRMILTNRQGETSTREIRNRALEVEGEGDKSLSIFDEPADVKGTAFLSHTHSTRPGTILRATGLSSSLIWPNNSLATSPTS